MTKAFNDVLQMSLERKVYMREAAYLVAIDKVVRSMRLRGWV
jgi:glutamate dehydrogenase